MDFTEVKGLLQSKTIWGVIITLIGTFLGWNTETQGVMVDQTMLVVTGIIQAVGAGLTVYGRIKAETKVTLGGGS